MSQLTIFADQNPSNALVKSTDTNEIKQHLAQVGVNFEQWQAQQKITPAMTHGDILQSYQMDIERVQANGGYQTVDVIALEKGNPNAAQLREKFLFEHTHNEDEVRFFVKGQGLFCLHIDDKVYQVHCQQGDLISVPANTAHWFDMGSDPEFTAIRFFNNEAGWVAQSTESDIAKRFPTLD
ncbi:1,2-dihydroxy-3-keto-5-methylthiopentene dioxygenase [Pseudoalteromonas sp. S16_S37]|uniref:1,2-dihydroxy-3-keto-5-methylthiopentene dioxygenase n=1 Tax=Pseudoalteromonas sp. S16_S37 TaxID=2720228 RepID=UPI001680E3CF|nr:cupin domain-containing protein [Pseudoalteromonas sp. S16_S37]MBD1583332.1 cupin domain-containing protein [Pseudoalteromonas sp. S16_S37]